MPLCAVRPTRIGYLFADTGRRDLPLDELCKQLVQVRGRVHAVVAAVEARRECFDAKERNESFVTLDADFARGLERTPQP